jgi:hypothetical protein
MEMWTKVRRSVLTGKLSKRQACKQYEIHWETLEKILDNPEPPEQRRQGERAKPVISLYLSIIPFWISAATGLPCFLASARNSSQRLANQTDCRKIRFGRG